MHPVVAALANIMAWFMAVAWWLSEPALSSSLDVVVAGVVAAWVVVNLMVLLYDLRLHWKALKDKTYFQEQSIAQQQITLRYSTAFFAPEAILCVVDIIHAAFADKTKKTRKAH